MSLTKLNISLAVVLFALMQSTFASTKQCQDISCDCSNLIIESWKSICSNQEKLLQSNCESNTKNLGFCSVHGPDANRLPLYIKTDLSTKLAPNEIKRQTHVLGILVWEIHDDFEKIVQYVNNGDFEKINGRINELNSNVDKSFQAQLTLGNALHDLGSVNESEFSWREYSGDTLIIATNLFSHAEEMLNTYGEIQDPFERKRYHQTALKLMATTGKVFEQLAYSYSNGQRHKHAARSWKKSSDVSQLLLSHNINLADDDIQHLRYQSAARLHRASYHWILGSGRGNAAESLAKSKEFMDPESAEAISVLVEDERNYKQAQAE